MTGKTMIFGFSSGWWFVESIEAFFNSSSIANGISAGLSFMTLFLVFMALAFSSAEEDLD